MSENQTPIVFTGKAGEYFGIWIVNLLLSIVTLGIYSAWAKVRRKKYFYNNILIEDVGFDYHARPIAILKGRIIAFVLFILYQVLAHFSPIAAGVLLVLFLIALPWIFVRGMLFNARNSSHRGLRFDFDGTYGQAALVILGYLLLIVVTFGLALPFVMQRTNQFVFNHHKFGLSHFQMNALVKDFYKIYLKLLGVLVLIGVIAGVGVSALTHKLSQHASIEPQQTHVAYTSTPADAGGFIKVDAASDNEKFKAETEAYMQNLSPEERAQFEAQMRAMEAEMANTQNEENASSIEKPKNPFEKLSQLGIYAYVGIFIGILIYAIVIFTIASYVHSRIVNLVWNNTRLDHLGFLSNQRMRDLVWLYLSNIIVLIITLGLATPWAQIRMARYRVSRLNIVGATNWDQFVGEKKAASRAVGEEIADMFDIDLSFG